ncbi:uncharacterized protein PV06_09218 [Exophiala oligosperma]|uniref:Filamentation protein n=1 Tax=Exophiala oligosperma TaxID=215243 RepID=A0A0D2DR45_9EURO|nr:uncharacterized protein PV06_09218 [Exophiala oligosperma]KIW38234.1 hypothetical protein PV06_09218 [Exophiala oligosperma]
MSVHQDKAQRYISLLDTARISANWQELPELIRKVTKHAPDRKCLIQTAKVEYSVASSQSQRPNTASSNRAPTESDITSLEAEIRAGGQPFEDSVQGQAALLWAQWAGGNKQKKHSQITFEPSRTAADVNSVWTKICVVKAVYIQGMFMSQGGDEQQGQELHSTLLPWLDSNRSLVVSTPQLLYWAQQLLGRIALGQRPAEANSFPASNNDTTSFRLQAFRHWAVLTAKAPDVSRSTSGNSLGHLSKLMMWRAYYRFISDILLRKPRTPQSSPMNARADLSNELRRVETSYENELLRNTQFPKADGSNQVIEEWVEEFIRNWCILCGPDWSESDLGEGGRDAVGRNVLDMLYRAATKTFHSTLIFRRLFQVHKALADFDLAYKALDTYVELMDRARAAASQAGGESTKRDSDHIYLQTIAEAVEGLSSFGRAGEAEKGYNLSLKLEDLLDELEPQPDVNVLNGSNHTSGDPVTNGFSTEPLPPEVVEVVYRAIGIGKAQWARFTPTSEGRSNLQSDAIESLRKAASQDLPVEQRLNCLFALGRMLGETREIDEAIAVVKLALSCDSNEVAADQTYDLQRDLIPFWHLLALLLSSKQNFEIASQSCAAAFEQFPSSDIIFGVGRGAARSGEKQMRGQHQVGLVDDMECDELQRIIEIRISELALTELSEGPEHAVNNSNDLLALYSRLFGRHGTLTLADERSRSRTKILQVPKSSAGTIKSSKGSIFSRRAGRLHESPKAQKAHSTPSVAEEPRRPDTQTTQAPTIHVTNEDEKPSPHKHRLFRTSHEHSKDEKRHGSRRLSRSRSRGRTDPGHKSDTGESFETTPEKVSNSEEPSQPALETITSQDVPAVPASTDHDESSDTKQPLKEVPHNLATHDTMPPPVQHQQQPPEQDIRLPTRVPSDLVPRFPQTASQRHALSILVKIWLIIAMLYRRAKMFDDSREACDEAAKVASKLESIIASVESSARAFSSAGWGGGGKSSDELWADVYCERAELLMAIAREKEEKEGQVCSEGVRDAVEQYETCLMCFVDHPGGIVGLSTVLLDYYERKVELARRVDSGPAKMGETPADRGRKQHRRELSRSSDSAAINGGPLDTDTTAGSTTALPSRGSKDDELKKTPENLNRLAARDRAYGLLSSLTKLGSGWDNSEAWFALARAHELGGEVDKAKEILWWCVELEDSRPIRHWSNLGCSGYVL